MGAFISPPSAYLGNKLSIEQKNVPLLHALPALAASSIWSLASGLPHRTHLPHRRVAGSHACTRCSQRSKQPHRCVPDTLAPQKPATKRTPPAPAPAGPPHDHYRRLPRGLRLRQGGAGGRCLLQRRRRGALPPGAVCRGAAAAAARSTIASCYASAVIPQCRTMLHHGGNDVGSYRPMALQCASLPSRRVAASILACL